MGFVKTSRNRIAILVYGNTPSTPQQMNRPKLSHAKPLLPSRPLAYPFSVQFLVSPALSGCMQSATKFQGLGDLRHHLALDRCRSLVGRFSCASFVFIAVLSSDYKRSFSWSQHGNTCAMTYMQDTLAHHINGTNAGLRRRMGPILTTVILESKHQQLGPRNHLIPTAMQARENSVMLSEKQSRLMWHINSDICFLN